MLDAGLTQIDSGLPSKNEVVSQVKGADFTPLSAQMMDRAIENVNAQHGNTLLPTASEKPEDQIAKLQKQIEEEAKLKGIDLKTLDADAPPQKVGLVGRVKGFFSRAWSWTRKSVDEFIKKLEGKNIIAKVADKPNKPPVQSRGSQTMAPPMAA